MSFIVTARKWRPMVFEDVVGQAHVTTTIRNAIAANRLSHAYIFSGPRGVGKTTTARILAKAINCLHPKEYNPDNQCELCTEITENRSVNVFEIDGASNRGVDEIRNLREAVRYGPAKGKYKIYIIDEVHMLTKEAFNALLKTLEEPPPHVLFIFATTEIHKVPLTILSRCQRFEFRRISSQQIIERLRYIAKEEGITINDEALFIIAKKGDGSLRDAQSMFDQIVSFCGTTISVQQIIEMLNIVDEELFFKMVDIIKAKDTKAGMALVDDVINRGVDIREFLSGLAEHLRNILIARTTGSTDLIETSEIYKERYAGKAKEFSETDLLRLIKIVTDTEAAIRWSQQPRFKLEIAVMQLIKMDSSVDIHHLLEQVDELKKKQGADQSDIPQFPHSARERQPQVIRPAKGMLSGSADRQIGKVVAEEITPRFIANEPGILTQQTSPADDHRISNIVIDSSPGKWTTLIEEARKHRIALGTMLSETTLVDIKDNKLQIGCPDSFHSDALKLNREFLTQLAQRIYGAKVHLETILSNTVSPQSQTQPQPLQPHESSVPRQETMQHPVVQALIREFGAERIE